MQRCARALALPLALILALAAAALCVATNANIQITNSSELLAKTLQRQLMKDNYDYMSTESDEPEPHIQGKQNHSNEVRKQVKENKLEVKNNKIIAEKLKDKSRSYRNAESVDADLERTARRQVLRKLAKRRKKIQKYIYDIDEDMAKRYKSRSEYNISDEDNSFTGRKIEQTATVKYKLLKLRSPYRRSGHAAALIQEESTHGVSIVKLGIGPFPEFRLPLPRRQYMDVPQPLKAVGDDEKELPPPPVDDKTTGDENAHTEVNNEKQNTLRAPKNYLKEEKNYLKITVTPDEILVL